METCLDRGMLLFLLAVLMPLWLFLSVISFPEIPACLDIQQSSTVFLKFSRFAMVCFSFCSFGLVGICFLRACKQLLQSVNLDMFFYFVADIVFRARCIACVTAVNIGLNFGSEEGYMRFPVVSTATTPFPLRSYLCIGVSIIFFFNDFFKSFLVRHS